MLEKIQEFLAFLKQNKTHQFNFFCCCFLFCLVPVKNYYTDLVIAAQPPMVRSFPMDLGEISTYPVNITNQPAPQLTASAFLIIDVDSKAILSQKNPDQRLFPASITKLMTALVSLDHYQLDQVLEVKEVKKVGRLMGLEKGDKFTVENLLYGLLVQSGNEVAYVLAQNYPGGLEKFVEAMNQKAKELHLENTNFVNPAGLDTYDHLTTAHDLGVLSTEVIKNPILSQIVATKNITVTDVTAKKKYALENVNQLLGEVEGLKGIKTGWTGYADECLVSLIEREDKKIVVVVLGSQDRFGETKKLIDWVFTNFSWEAIPQ